MVGYGLVRFAVVLVCSHGYSDKHVVKVVERSGSCLPVSWENGEQRTFFFFNKNVTITSSFAPVIIGTTAAELCQLNVNKCQIPSVLMREYGSLGGP